jgi:integrase
MHTQVRSEHGFLGPRHEEPWFEERTVRRRQWEPTLRRLGRRHRPPCNTRHTCPTMMLMASMTPAFCAKQLGHSVERFLRTCAKWIDGGQNALERARLEAALAPDLSQIYPKKSR